MDVFKSLPEYPDLKKIKNRPEYQRDLRFRSPDNWGGNLTPADKERIEWNLRLHGAMIDPKSHQYIGGPSVKAVFKPASIAAKIEGHWKEVKAAAKKRFIGTPIINVLEGLYQALLFGTNVYCEGPAGTGKTEVMRYLAAIVAHRDLVAEFNATSDATDFNLLGGETVQGGGSHRYRLSRGPLLKPGALTLMIDELARLGAQVSNVLLDPMARRETVVPLVASEGIDLAIALSPSFFVTGVGNPIHYGGQAAERSTALFDRFNGLYMPQPSSADRITMYDLYLSQMEQDWERERVPFTFTFREAQAARAAVTISPEMRNRICAASFGISPTAFRSRVGWNSCEHHEAYVKTFQGDYKKRLKTLGELVDQSLMEGSTPRGEIALLFNAQALALLDGQLVADEVHVAKAFCQANRARLKFFPGCEDTGEQILKLAVEVYFPSAADAVSLA